MGEKRGMQCESECQNTNRTAVKVAIPLTLCTANSPFLRYRRLEAFANQHRMNEILLALVDRHVAMWTGVTPAAGFVVRNQPSLFHIRRCHNYIPIHVVVDVDVVVDAGC
jgi:hypothetical protein